MLEEWEYRHFEEPCPYWDLDATKAVADALEIDVAGGKQDCDLATWRRIIDARVVDAVQPDILHIDGLSRALRVAKLAGDAGLPVTPHAANLSMETLLTLHFPKSLPDAGDHLEYSIEGSGHFPWQIRLFVESPSACPTAA